MTTLAELAAEAGVAATGTEEPPEGWLGAMFSYYDAHGLLVGALTMEMLLGRLSR